jgi:hypothetical protein
MLGIQALVHVMELHVITKLQKKSEGKCQIIQATI